MILSTVPGIVVLGCSRDRAVSRFISVILADLAMLSQMRFHSVLSQAKLRRSRPCSQQLVGTLAVGGLVDGRDKSRSCDYALPGERDGFRSLVSNAARCSQSCSVTAVNFNPSPLPGSACRTTASALICPS
jgi:hypothetical protein